MLLKVSYYIIKKLRKTFKKYSLETTRTVKVNLVCFKDILIFYWKITQNNEINIEIPVVVFSAGRWCTATRCVLFGSFIVHFPNQQAIKRYSIIIFLFLFLWWSVVFTHPHVLSNPYNFLSIVNTKGEVVECWQCSFPSQVNGKCRALKMTKKRSIKVVSLM